MNILIVDDQASVLYGIRQNLDFAGLGFARAFFAAGAEEARHIIETEEIHVMLCDIEMPGEDGLSLNEWVQETNPDMIRILLTSHAEFSYARQSIRLGCFDYIVQPAPYDEIEAVLRKAAEKYRADESGRKLLRHGQVYNGNKMQMLEKTIYKLYSANEDDVNQSVRILNQMGYLVSDCSGVQMIMINIFDYVRRDDPDYADFRNRQILVSALDTCGMAPSLSYFLCENTLHQYVILLVSAAGLPMDIPEDFYVVLYEKIRAGLRVAPGMYVSSFTELKSLRKKAGETNTIYLNNTDHKPGIYYTSEKVVLDRTLDLKENMHRWKLLLNGKQYKNLRESIFSHVDFLLKVNKLNYADICNLHQQLTQMFFSYSYENNIDIMDLFQGEYSYNDYMDGFSDSRSLKEAMGYIITAIGKVEQDEGTDVDKAKQYILDNLSKNFTVRDVAEHVHLSPEYFTKVFKTKTGQNIKNYILQVKLDVAKDLLATPNIPISMIAAEIGYDNFSHFTQIFKKYEDITPTEYRKKILG